MSKKFDPDKAHVKVRGMNGIHYEQNGSKFSAGHQYVGQVDGSKAKPEKPEKSKEDVRKSAAAKIAKKMGKKGSDPLDGFRPKETPDAVTGAKKEDQAARQAEENAG